MKVLPILNRVGLNLFIKRHDTILQLLELYDIIINCLDELGNSNEETTLIISKATNLNNFILKFEV